MKSGVKYGSMWSENVLAISATRFVCASSAMRALSAGPSRQGLPAAGSASAHWMAEASVGVTCRFSGTPNTSCASSTRK
jgi:hypothetical protein